VNGRARLRERARQWCRSPLFWILCAALVFRLAGIGWGLPASDGWDDDGVAPRNFLVGLAQTYTSGAYFAYPPLHMILLALLTAPGWIAALSNAHSLTQPELIAEIIRVPYMTFFAVVARLVSVAMSLGTIYAIGKTTEIIGGRRAGLCAAAAITLNAALIYYGQVTNLDGPYLFWSALAIWGWVRVIAEHEPRHFYWAALCAAAAIATKDQASALFLLSLPVSLLLWLILDPWPRQHARKTISALLLSAAIAIFMLLLVDGALTNHAGFAKRLAFLVGPASQDYAQYPSSWHGRAQLVADMWASFPSFYPSATSLLAAWGIWLVLQRVRDRSSRSVAGLLPLLAIVSFTVAFNFLALRTEIRFLLPQSVFLAVYVGIAIDRLAFAPRPLIKLPIRFAILAIATAAIYQCAGIDAAFIDDPRYEAERWLNENAQPGDRIETYGLNVYLPRFPAAATVTRVDRKPLIARNPLPGVIESDQPFELIGERNPRIIVINAFSLRDYLDQDEAASAGGRAVQKVQQSATGDNAARRYFAALFAGELPYRLALRSAYAPHFWPAIEGYESLAQTILIFERAP